MGAWPLGLPLLLINKEPETSEASTWSAEFTLKVIDPVTFVHCGLDQARQRYHTVWHVLACWKLLSQLLPVLPKSHLLVCTLACYKTHKRGAVKQDD